MPKPPAAPQPKMNWRLWLRVSVWALVFAGAAWGAKEVHSYLLRDPEFTLDALQIQGITYTSKDRIRSVFSSDFGRSVFQVPLAERRRHLLAVDWVKTASITRVWPNRLIITITERQPIAFAKLPVPGTTRYWSSLIDEEGVLLRPPARVRFRLPLLSGLTEEQSDDERKLRVEAMNQLLADLGPEARQLTEINAASTRDLRVMANVQNQAVELWIGDQHYRSRFLNFLSHYDEIHTHSEHATVFDLRFDDRILAR